jgi:hypothetical protein
MSIVKLNKNNFATKSVNLSTQRQFISSSMGVTGALKVIVDRSHTQKDNIDDRVGLTGLNEPQPFGENTFEGRRLFIMEALSSPDIAAALLAGDQDIYDSNIGEMELAQLLDGSGINAGVPPPEYEKYGLAAESDKWTETGYSDISMHPRNSTELMVRTLKPTSSLFSSGSMALTMAEKILEPYHRVRNSMIGSKYVNFNCMNFFDAEDNMALFYHGQNSPAGASVYDINNDISVEFWIKINPSISRGTVIHSRGQFSVAVIPNTVRDEKGMPISYAIGFAYGELRTEDNSDKPSSLNYGTDSYTLLSDYFLTQDIWTHCAVTLNYNAGEILFYKDGEVSSAQMIITTPPVYDKTHKLITLGSYYFGPSGCVAEQRAQGLGIATTNSTLISSDVVDSLDAEIHEIRIWKKIITKKDVVDYLYKTYAGSVADHQSKDLMFYVPCLYDVDYRTFPTQVVVPRLSQLTKRETLNHQPVAFRQNYLPWTEDGDSNSPRIAGTVTEGAIGAEYNNLADIYDCATVVVTTQQVAPYNTNQANIGNFANVNIQAFTKDYANLLFPFCHHMSESLGDPTSSTPIFETFLPKSSLATIHTLTSSFSTILGHQARNCFILPCDNGNFRPDYSTLNHSSGSIYLQNDGFFINTKNIGSLDDLLDSRLFFIDDVFASKSTFLAESQSTHTTQGGDTRYNSGLDLFSVIDSDLTDTNIPNFMIPSSDDPSFTSIFSDSDFPGPLTTIITVPQLYYGNRIKPGSIKIKSKLYNGTKSQIELRDNGNGILYRHQTSGSVADWNKVGDVYYGEGLIYVRNPSLYAIADSDIDIEFKSENKINVLETNVFCKAGLVNSSSNPNHVKVKPSHDENEQSEEFVYISTVYLHDDNLNVIAKAKLAQPIIKRSENKFLFRLKVDF